MRGAIAVGPFTRYRGGGSGGDCGGGTPPLDDGHALDVDAFPNAGPKVKQANGLCCLERNCKDFALATAKSIFTWNLQQHVQYDVITNASVSENGDRGPRNRQGEAGGLVTRVVLVIKDVFP